VATLAEYLVQYGAAIGYAAVGLFALLALGVIQWIRRRRDVDRARTAVRLVTYSICDPRQGPVAVTGAYRESQGERWIECKGQRVVLEQVEVVRGTRAQWKSGVRTYAVRDRDAVIAIGVMSRLDGATWRLAPSPEEAGVQVYAVTPTPAPPPLWPWRAPLILAICGGIAFGALYEVGEVLVDKPACSESGQLRLQIAAAMPLAREDALAKLRQCSP
jgi:hypothetical protein